MGVQRGGVEVMILLLSLFYLCWITVGRQVHCKNSINFSAQLLKVYSAEGLPVPLKYRQDWCQLIRAHLSGTGKNFSRYVGANFICTYMSRIFFNNVLVFQLISNKGRTNISVESSLHHKTSKEKLMIINLQHFFTIKYFFLFSCALGPAP